MKERTVRSTNLWEPVKFMTIVWHYLDPEDKWYEYDGFFFVSEKAINAMLKTDENVNEKLPLNSWGMVKFEVADHKFSVIGFLKERT